MTTLCAPDVPKRGCSFRLALAAMLSLPFASPLGAQTGYEAVDPMIGTGGEGHTFPGAVAPFGMVQLSPDTDTGCTIRDCYDHAAGYCYDDPIRFSEPLAPHAFVSTEQDGSVKANARPVG